MELADIQPVDTSSIERAPEPDQTHEQEQAPDPELLALQRDARRLAGRRQELDMAAQQLTAQGNAGQIPIDQELAARQLLDQWNRDLESGAKDYFDRENAYKKRQAQNRSIEIAKAIPEWSDSKRYEVESYEFARYLQDEKGMTEGQVKNLSIPRMSREYRKWEKVMKSRMSANERRMHEANEKIRAAKADNPDFGKSNAQKAQERTGPRMGNPIQAMQAEFKSAHGRELSRAEVRAALITGELPSK